MASGREKETASVAEWGLTSSEKLAEEDPSESSEETSSEEQSDEEYTEIDDDTEDEAAAAAAAERWNTGLAAQLGNGGMILVLFEMPSGFAIFSNDGIKLLEPNACENIWADFFHGSVAKRVVVFLTFQIFKDKSIAINQHTGVSEVLNTMIMKHRDPEQKLAVGNMNYKEIIEDHLGISCLCGLAVEELVWGLTIQLGNFVPTKDSGLTNEDLSPPDE